MDLSSHRIFFHLRSKERNADIIDLLPHREYMGMLVTYRYIPANDINPVNSKPVYCDFCSSQAISEEELYKLSVTGLDNFFVPSLYALSDFASELKGGAVAKSLYNATDLPTGVYLCTNQFRLYGAHFLCDNKILKNFAASFNSSYYILPSSIHEFLLVPTASGQSPEYLQNTLCSLNKEEMSSINVLSDDLLFYNADTDTLTTL